MNAYGRRLAVGAVVAVLTVTAGCESSPPSSTWESTSQPSASAPFATPLPTTSTPAGTPSASATGQPSPPPSALDICAAGTVAKMSVAQMAGQVMLVGTPLDDIGSVEHVIRTYQIGGVFLSGRSHSSASKLRAAIASMQAAAPRAARLLISLDQEGGTVQALQGAGFPPIPTAVAQGQLSASALSAQATTWAKRLASIGVTLDLAPVADTVPASLGTKNPPIGGLRRQYGSDPTDVAADISTVVTAVQATGVLTTLKHFPGLGRVLVNTDFSAKAVDNVATTHDTYLEPFSAGIKARTGAVMISSASYPKLDPHSIATFSRPIVTGLLREQLGYTGLIISDSLAGAAAISSVPLSQRGVLFIEAGGDLVLTTTASKAPAMINGLIAAARGSTSFAAQLKTAAGYVVRSKYAIGLLTCSPPKP